MSNFSKFLFIFLLKKPKNFKKIEKNRRITSTLGDFEMLLFAKSRRLYMELQGGNRIGECAFVFVHTQSKKLILSYVSDEIKVTTHDGVPCPPETSFEKASTIAAAVSFPDIR